MDRQSKELYSILVISLSVVIVGISSISSVKGQLEIPDAKIINEDETSEIGNNTSNSNSFLEYGDKDLGFSLEYPDNWEVGSGSDASKIVLFSAPDNTASAYVIYLPRQEDDTLKSFGDKFVKENENFRFNEYYRNSTTLLADQPAIRASGTYFNTITNLEASLGYESSTTKTLQVVTLDETNDAFIGIIFHADDQTSYNKYLPLVEHMIKSFKLISTGPIISEEN
jgi:hypothetical protein